MPAQMFRLPAALALLGALALGGCSQTVSPSVPSAGSGSSALPSASTGGSLTTLNTDANGSTYALTSFDGTSLLIGLNAQGKTFSATYGSTTSFKLAVLDKYAPTDPCREAAASYNTYVGTNDTVGFNASLTALATVGGVYPPCKAKVLLSDTLIKTFQPQP